jgi:hypothetical protein
VPPFNPFALTSRPAFAPFLASTGQSHSRAGIMALILLLAADSIERFQQSHRLSFSTAKPHRGEK